MSASSLIVGEVIHVRRGEHSRRFRYRHCSWLIDLDEITELDRRLRPVFGVDRRRPFSLRPSSHLPLDAGATLRERVASCLERHERPTDVDRVLLVGTVAAFGHGFDPVSWICCHDGSGALHTIIAEVHNTFGESHTYVLPVDGATAARGEWISHDVRKAFHVSPFLPSDLSYELAARPPTLAAGGASGEPVAFRVTVRTPDGSVLFVGLQQGRRRALTRKAALRELLRSPLQPQLVSLRIRWHAVRLWLGRAALHRKPAFTPHVGSHHRSTP